NLNNGINQISSKQQLENETDFGLFTNFGLFTEDNGILEPNQFLNIIDSDKEAGSSKKKYYNNESDSNIVINTSTIGASPTNNINQFTIDTKNRVNDVIKKLLPYKDLEEIWELVMSRLNAKNIKVQIKKLSKGVQTRKRRKIHAEYVKFGNESTKVNVAIELHNYGIELVSMEVGNVEMDNNDLKLREDHIALKIELKDMLDNFRDKLHFKKKDIAEIFVMGIQITGVKNFL
ncbi:28085_t:CDS:2, partial [Gigaspora margarita]